MNPWKEAARRIKSGKSQNICQTLGNMALDGTISNETHLAMLRPVWERGVEKGVWCAEWFTWADVTEVLYMPNHLWKQGTTRGRLKFCRKQARKLVWGGKGA